MSMVAIWIAAAVPVHGFAATADDANAGKTLRTFQLAGTPADCSSNTPGIGTSIALVQGSKINQPQSPVVLVTSCLASGGAKTAIAKRSTLYFIDAVAGTLLTTIQTRSGSQVFAPGSGWAELVLAADKGVLFGCGDDGSLYTIDFSALNTVTDGTVTAVPKPTLATSCTGLAWDPSDKTIYQSAGNTIFHFTQAGATLATYGPPPTPACTVKGLSVAGGVLIIACSDGTMQRVAKLTGAPLGDHQTLTSQATALSDLECDPVTFASTNIDALWTKLSATQQIQALRVPGGTCGLPATATVFAPAACPDPTGAVDPYRNSAPGNPIVDGTPKDTDGDGLWDCWEDGARWTALDGKPGIDFNGDGNRDVVLCAMVDTTGTGVANVQECADPQVKDVFVELDFMENPDGSKSHRPDPLALFLVRQAFANAPVSNPSPLKPTGIGLHVQVDDPVVHTDLLALEPCTNPASSVQGAVDFDAIKATFFGTGSEKSNPNALFAKSFGFRYVLFGHTLVGTTASGCSEVPGNDSTVTLGGFGVADATGHKRGTTDQQAGTFMHELGHTLGLRHGGGDNLNCKPNYLSVMSYSRQFADFITNRPLDYSRAALPAYNLTHVLDESSLDESAGLGTSTVLDSGAKTVHSVPAALTPYVAAFSSTSPSIDWSGDNKFGGTVAADTNKLTAAGCDGTGTLLAGYDDWQNLVYNARATIEFGSGRVTDNTANTPSTPEKTVEQEAASFVNADYDGDGISDALACRASVVVNTPLPNPLPSPLPCIIDIKPGTNPKVINKGSTSNIQVAIRATLDFDPSTQVIRETLTLNGVLVKLNNQGRGTCSTALNANGRLDLLCQFPVSALPLGTNYSVLEGKANVVVKTTPSDPGQLKPTAIRARDVVTVVQ